MSTSIRRRMPAGDSRDLMLDVRTRTGVPINLNTAPQVTVIDPTGRTVSQGQSSLEVAGRYRYVFSSPVDSRDGFYKAIWSPLDDDGTGRVVMRFEVYRNNLR